VTLSKPNALLRFAIILTAACLARQGAAAATYTFTSYDVPLGTLAGTGSINNQGEAIGSYWGPSFSAINGYTLPSSGTIQGGIAYPEVGVFYTWAASLNSAVTIAGWYGDTAFHGFLLTNGVYTSYNVAGAINTEIWGINDSGHLAGFFDHNGGNSQGFLDTGTGTAQIIAFPKALSTGCYGLNNQDTVVGIYSGSDNVVHGFLKRLKGKFTKIDMAGAGANGTNPQAVNSASLVAGYYYDTNNKRHGFTFSAGVYTAVDYPGANETLVTGINKSGWLTGNYYDSVGTHGFIAKPAAAGPAEEPAQ
jgi:hypothetical protein